MPGPTLDSVCVAIVDCEHKTAPVDESGDFFAVGTPAMRGNSIDYGEARRISASTFDAWTRRMRPRLGDLLLAREAPVGPVALIPPRENVAPGQRTVLLRPDRDRVDSVFLFYLLASSAQQDRLRAMAEGSTVAHLNVVDVRGFRLPVLPAVLEQRAIADVLTALDDKIAANARLIGTADALSGAVFQSLTETQPLPLTSVADFVNGRAFTKDASGTGRVVVRIAELNSGIGGSTVFSDAEVPDQHVARPGDILFAWSGSLTLHRWFRSEAIVNQHIFKVIPHAGYPHWLVWGLLAKRLDEFRAIAADKATTMGHIQRRHLEEPVAVPVPALVAQHNDAMTALWNRALAAEQESLTLAATRDALLPALMSGRLQVRDVDFSLRGRDR